MKNEVPDVHCYDYDNLNGLKDKIIKEIYLNEDCTKIKFVLANDETQVYDAEGDCCSNSWISNMSGIPSLEIYGGDDFEITKVEDVHLPFPANEIRADFDTIKLYGIKLHYKDGYILVEFRNSSNGYYGGWLGYVGKSKGLKGWKKVTEDF